MAAANTPSAPVGPVPFKDVDVDGDQAVFPEQPPEELADMVSSLPSMMDDDVPVRIRCYQGVWLPESWVPAAVALQRSLVPRPDDVIVASLPKCGTTWLIALVFSTLARHTHPPAAASHPLRRLNPHQCLPFLESLFLKGREAILDTLPSPRLMNTHMPIAMLPRATPATINNGCKVIYIYRDPKDAIVSLWYYIQRMAPGMSFANAFEKFCNGTVAYGPFWDHILGYWHASMARPNNVLFLRYEELLHDPTKNVRKLARFIGLPFSEAEEETGVINAIIQLCSLDNLRGIEANKTGYVDSQGMFPRESLFRKGMAGDWVNHVSPDMARRLDDIIANKFSATGLKF